VIPEGDQDQRQDSAVELAAFVLGSQRIPYGGILWLKEVHSGLKVVFETGVSVVVSNEAMLEYFGFPGTFAEFKATPRGYFHVISTLSTLSRVSEG
jgi:hypothetical protein